MIESIRSLSGTSATWDGHELDFSMSMSGLLDFQECIRAQAWGAYSLDVTHTEGLVSVSAIEIRREQGRLKLIVESNRVLIVGGDQAMSLLADNMAGLFGLWAAGGEQHFHFDPSSDQLLLEPDSEAFILSRSRAQ